jgi:hypothetical protein
MRENKDYCCPLCNSAFEPVDGVTITDHLAHGIVAVFRELQLKAEHEDCIGNPLPCPRCGHIRMSPKVSRNALSRSAEIHVCDICGVDEAVRVYSGCVLPLSDWWIYREVLSIGNSINKQTRHA